MMFDRQSAKEYAQTDVDSKMPAVYDIIRAAIGKGKRNVTFAIGDCYHGNCDCAGKITELQLDNLIVQKYTVVQGSGSSNMFTGTSSGKGHYVISGWTMLEEKTNDGK